MTGRATTSIAALSLLALAACQPAELSTSQRAAVAAQVTAVMDTAMAGINRLDPQPFLTLLEGNKVYAENGMIFPTHDSLVAQVQSIPTMFQSVDLRWTSNPEITVLGKDAAVLTSRFAESVVDSAGTAITLTGIWTGVLQRKDGKWAIVQAHEHIAPVAQ